MKILIFGANGQLATQFQKQIKNHEVLAVGSHEAPFTDQDAVAKAIQNYKPTHILNTSAYTMVDKAETEKELALQINSEILKVIGEEARKIKSHVIHFSTDYIFDGEKKTPYVETDLPNPVNYYGFTKWQGEKNLTASGCHHTILRVSWLYGAAGTNFLRTILTLIEKRPEIRVVNDQRGAPTSSVALARVVLRMITDPDLNEKSGLYHLSPAGETTWYEFAKKIWEWALTRPDNYPVMTRLLLPISSSEYPTPARRPHNSLMSSKLFYETFHFELAPWLKELELILKELK